MPGRRPRKCADKDAAKAAGRPRAAGRKAERKAAGKSTVVYGSKPKVATSSSLKTLYVQVTSPVYSSFTSVTVSNAIL